MKHILYSKTGFLLVLVCLFSIMATGCIRENLEACPEGNCVLQLQVLAPDSGADATEGGLFVTDARVYVYGEDRELLKSFNLSDPDIRGRRNMEIEYAVGKQITVVGWGNVGSDTQTLNEAGQLEDLSVSLISDGAGEASHPDTLYFGSKTFTIQPPVDGDSTVYVIPVDQVVGEMNAQTINFDKALLKAGLRAEDIDDINNVFQFRVDKTLSTFNYNGELVGDSVYYSPEGAMNDTSTEWEILESEARVVAPGNQLTVEAILDGVSLGGREAISPQTGEPYIIEPKVNTLFIIEWDGEGNYIGVTTEVRPWGYVDDPHPF